MLHEVCFGIYFMLFFQFHMGVAKAQQKNNPTKTVFIYIFELQIPLKKSTA